MNKTSQMCYISRSHGGGTPGAISMKLGAPVYIVSSINSAKFNFCSFNGLNFAGGLNFTIFPCLTLRLIQHC
jgi:hypothetical protein